VKLTQKNPKTLSLRKLLDEEREKVSFPWVPGHMRIPVNEIVDKEAKAALAGDILSTKKYPPQDLINWIKTEDKKTRKKEKQDGKIAKTI
jgi:ribonuclease HI